MHATCAFAAVTNAGQRNVRDPNSHGVNWSWTLARPTFTTHGQEFNRISHRRCGRSLIFISPHNPVKRGRRAQQNDSNHGEYEPIVNAVVSALSPEPRRSGQFSASVFALRCQSLPDLQAHAVERPPRQRHHQFDESMHAVTAGRPNCNLKQPRHRGLGPSKSSCCRCLRLTVFQSVCLEQLVPFATAGA